MSNTGEAFPTAEEHAINAGALSDAQYGLQEAETPRS